MTREEAIRIAWDLAIMAPVMVVAAFVVAALIFWLERLVGKRN